MKWRSSGPEHSKYWFSFFEWCLRWSFLTWIILPKCTGSHKIKSWIIPSRLTVCISWWLLSGQRFSIVVWTFSSSIRRCWTFSSFARYFCFVEKEEENAMFSDYMHGYFDIFIESSSISDWLLKCVRGTFWRQTNLIEDVSSQLEHRKPLVRLRFDCVVSFQRRAVAAYASVPCAPFWIASDTLLWGNTKTHFFLDKYENRHKYKSLFERRKYISMCVFERV